MKNRNMAIFIIARKNRKSSRLPARWMHLCAILFPSIIINIGNIPYGILRAVPDDTGSHKVHSAAAFFRVHFRAVIAFYPPPDTMCSYNGSAHPDCDAIHSGDPVNGVIWMLPFPFFLPFPPQPVILLCFSPVPSCCLTTRRSPHCSSLPYSQAPYIGFGTPEIIVLYILHHRNR